MVTTTQLALVAGIPSLLIILSTLDFHRQARRLSRKLDAISAEMSAAIDTRRDARAKFSCE